MKTFGERLRQYSRSSRQVVFLQWRAGLIILLLLAISWNGWPQDSDQETLSWEFGVFETVLVFVEGGIKSAVIDERDFLDKRYFDFGRFTVRVAAITDYELRVSAAARIEKDLVLEELDVSSLQIKLVREGITGHLPTEINNGITDFIDAVRLPDSYYLFRGKNNTRDDLNTIVPIEARVDLRDLPADKISAGAIITYIITFIVMEL